MKRCFNFDWTRDTASYLKALLLAYNRECYGAAKIQFSRGVLLETSP